MKELLATLNGSSLLGFCVASLSQEGVISILTSCKKSNILTTLNSSFYYN
ncbi:hypothetical protein NC651_021912 [Populus alba x Populus x berolinensis]|nr:hypothetical protein NC651_021912 [Populus alba x Populus x berolinensis]